MQRQAILADRQRVDGPPDRRQFRSPRASGGGLRRTAGIDDRLADACPLLGFARWPESVGARCRRTVGNAFEDMHAARRDAGNAA